jgi:hypothetical protein
MVRPHIRRRADSGIINRHTCRAMSMMGVPHKQLRRRMEEDNVKGVLFVQHLRTEEQTGNVISAQNGCARTILSRQLK